MLFASLSLVLMVPAFAETTSSKMNVDNTPLSGQTGINKTYYPSTTNGTLNGTTTGTTRTTGITGTTGTTGTTGITGTTGTTGTNNGYYYNRLNGSQTGTGLGTGLGTGFLGTGLGTGTNRTDGTYRPYSTYGTDGTYGTYDSTRMNAYRPYSTTNLTTRGKHNVRAMETTTTRRGFSWGWLGLIGLFGLAGMRSRSNNEVR